MMSQFRPFGPVVIVGILLFGSSPSAAAPDHAASRISVRKAPPAVTDFEAASKAEEQAIGEVLEVRARRTSLEARARDLDTEAAALGDRARQRAADLARLDHAQREVEAQLERTRLRLAAARTIAKRTAADMYRGAGSSAPPMLTLMSGTDSVQEAGSRLQYLERVGEVVMRDVDAVKTAQRQVANARRALRSQRVQVQQAAELALREQARVLALRADQDRALAAVRVEEDRENQVLAAAQSRRAEFERAAAAAQVASGTIEELLRARPVIGTAPTQYRFPADGPVTSPFGQRVHPIFGTVRLHAGIDIGASYGAPVWAGAGGVVVVSGPASGYGNAIVIDHGGGAATLYAHLSRLSVRTGQSVTAGQTIGAVGSSGNSTGPHLHFEVRVRGVPVNPMGYL